MNFTSAMQFVVSGDLNSLRKLQDISTDNEFYDILDYAIIHQKDRIVKHLLSTININDNKRLEKAVYANSPERIYALVRYGANIDIQNNLKETPLIIASILGQFQAVLALVNRNAEPNLQDHRGNTALHYACFYRYSPIYRQLLRYGASETIVNNDGKRPQALFRS